MSKQPRDIGKTLKIVNVPLDALKKYPGNPRCWTDEQKSHVKQSFRRYGCVDPLLLSGSKRNYNTILGGHLRAESARELGWTHIPAVYISIRDPKKERELVVRLNKNAGSWDYELLKSFDIDLLLEVGIDGRYPIYWTHSCLVSLQDYGYLPHRSRDQRANSETH